MRGQRLLVFRGAQVREIEAAALRAAHDGALQIENAMATAAGKVTIILPSWSDGAALGLSDAGYTPPSACVVCLPLAHLPSLHISYSAHRQQAIADVLTALNTEYVLAPQAVDASEVAALRTRLWEEETAAKETQAALEAAAAARDALVMEKSQLQTQISALQCAVLPPLPCGLMRNATCVLTPSSAHLAVLGGTVISFVGSLLLPAAQCLDRDEPAEGQTCAPKVIVMAFSCMRTRLG